MALTRRSTSPSCQMVRVTGRSSKSLAERLPSRLAKRSLRVNGWESASSREKSTTAKSTESTPASVSVKYKPLERVIEAASLLWPWALLVKQASVAEREDPVCKRYMQYLCEICQWLM